MSDKEKLAKMLEVVSATHEDAMSKGLKKGNGGASEFPCPACGGTIRYSVASVNGHIWGKCSTDGCAAWLE